MEGQQVGRFSVVRVVGQGAMGRVLEVQDPAQPGRRLALKQVLSSAMGAAGLERFRREAQLLARVQHPNVVRVHELGDSPEGPWLLMEMVAGEPLDELLRRRGRLEPKEAAGIAADLASAVAALHEVGVLHRDLKPANALLRPDGRPVLIDFGLAWAEDVERLTRTGVVMGSPAFMSPEQAEGKSAASLTAQTDVWGLGSTLFALVVGRAPFRGGGPAGVLVKVKTEPPKWPTREELDGRTLPPQLVRLLERTLAKDPHDRPAGARELEAALRRFVRGEPEPGRPRRKGLAAAGLLLLAVAAATLTWTIPRGQVATGSAAPSSSAPPPPPAPLPAPLLVPPAPEPPPLDLPGPRRLSHWDPELPIGVAFPPRDPRFERSDLPFGPVTWVPPGLDRDHRAHGLIRLWPRNRPNPLNLEVKNEEVEALAVLDAERALVVTRAGNRRWYVVPLEQKPRPRELELDEVPDGEPIAALAVRPGGRHVAIATRPEDEEEPARAWLFDLGRPPGGPSLELALGRAAEAARDLLFLPDGTLLVASAGGVDRWVPPMRLDARLRLARPAERAAASGGARPRSLAFAPGAGAWAGCDDGSIRHVVLAAERLGEPIGPAHGGPVLALRFDAAGERLWSLSPGEVRGWRREGNGWRVAGEVVEWPTPLGALALSYDGQVVVGLVGRAELWAAEWFQQGRRRYASVTPR